MNGNDRPSPRRSSVVDKYTTGRSRETETGGIYDLVEPGSTTSGNDGDQVRHHLCYSEHLVHQVTLRLILRNGLEHYLPYHYMEEEVYDPSGKLELFFTKRKVTISGQNLHPVALALGKQLVGCIKETDGRFTDGDGSDLTVITSLAVEIYGD